MTNSTPSNSTPRLKQAHDLYRAVDGKWRLSGPGDRFDRIELSGDVMESLASTLSPHRHQNQEARSQDIESLLDVFVEEGYAEREQTDPRPRLSKVCLDGDTPYLEAAARVLASNSLSIVRARESAEITVIGQLNLDDEAMLRRDELAVSRGRPVHRAFYEGGHWFVGPLTIAGQTATYADYRGRRLAACDVPEELLNYWQALPGLPPRMPEPAVSALIAGYIAGDVMALCAGEEPPTTGYQVDIDPETLRIEWHPVLPLPKGLWAAAGENR